MSTDRQLVQEAIAKFPLEFGLRAWPGDKFMISLSSSFVNGQGEVMLYLWSWNPGTEAWGAFSKCSIAELQSNIVPLKGVSEPRRLTLKEFRAMKNLESKEDFSAALGDMVMKGSATALCESACQVELDGVCEHGHPAVTMAMGLS